MSNLLTFDKALTEVSAIAHAKLPEALHGRLEMATALVSHGKVWSEEDGHAFQVASRSTPGRWHVCNGSCDCEDAHYQAPDGLCAHRLAVGLLRRTVERLEEEEERYDVVNSASETVAPVGIDPRFVVEIQGKPFVQVAGLLALAHARGLQSLTTTFTYNDADLAIAQSTAVFSFGSFTDVGDASPSNTNPKVRAHFRRVAATRATARALRLALNIDMCSLDELTEQEGSQ
ncbi:MAG TPA: hypothetical protein VLQ80_25855 [Candidatus Saccharimonadia bacterium]|nr:hypothetical protein [Candidatus Saccharimonadia bacterium]